MDRIRRVSFVEFSSLSRKVASTAMRKFASVAALRRRLATLLDATLLHFMMAIFVEG